MAHAAWFFTPPGLCISHIKNSRKVGDEMYYKISIASASYTGKKLHKSRSHEPRWSKFLYNYSKSLERIYNKHERNDAGHPPPPFSSSPSSPLSFSSFFFPPSFPCSFFFFPFSFFSLILVKDGLILPRNTYRLLLIIGNTDCLLSRSWIPAAHILRIDL